MVDYIGRITRAQVNDLYGRSRLGLVLYQPAANHYESQPIKMFEYMAAGLPVVASDFSLWRRIIEENSIGICVPPTDVNAVHNAIDQLMNAPEMGQQMGRNGRKAVMEKYNWSVEEKKLIALYCQL